MNLPLSPPVTVPGPKGDRIRHSSIREILFWIATAILGFHLSYWRNGTSSYVIVFYLFGLIQLTQVESSRKAFYSGLAVGLLVAVVQLEFFWRIFSVGAIALWVVFAFWIGLFTVLAQQSF